MSRVLKVSESDYRLQVKSGGNIVLDTGSAVGLVTITGNLDVKGTTTTVESTNTTVKDNILLLNAGQTGNGISSTLDYQAGIQIDRGNLSDAQFVFDESVEHWDPTANAGAGAYVPGTFIFKTADGALSGLSVAAISNDGTTNITFDLQNSNKILSIANSTDYYSRVTHDDDIPNRKFVTNYVYAVDGSAVTDRIYYPVTANYGEEDAKVQAFTDRLEFLVGQTLKTTISSAGVTVNNIVISGDTIDNTSASNLVLTANSQVVEIDATLALDNRVSAPATTSGKTKIYSMATAGPGKTGLFLKNSTTSDEFISKNRAVLFSILF